MLTVTITCLSFLNNLVTMQLSGWPGLSVGLREVSSGSGAFWRVRILQVSVWREELPVGVGGVSSGPTSDAALATTTGQRPLHHSDHPPRDMVTLPADTPTQYASWIEHAVGGVCQIRACPGRGQRGRASSSGGLHPVTHPGPIGVQGTVKLR